MTRLQIWNAMMCGLIISIASASPGKAAVIISSGAGAVQPDENIQYNDAGLVARGTTITGQTNNTNFVVDVEAKDVPLPTLDFELFTPSGGQARIEGIDGNDDMVFYSSVEIFPNAIANPGFGFTEMEFNINIQNGQSGLVELIIKGMGFGDITTMVDTGNSPMTLGNGANFFGIEAGPGELIQSVQISALNDMGQANALIIQDIRQLRVSGQSDEGGGTNPTIPEPATAASAAIALVTLLGFAGRRRRDRSGNR